MKKKINEISTMRNMKGSKNDLYTRYRYAFEHILPLNSTRYGSEEDDVFYIPDIELNQELDLLFTDTNDTLSILIGYAGIGKSTCLRHHFKFTNSAPNLREAEQVLIFPATFNGYVSDENEDSYVFDMKDDQIAKGIKDDLTLRIDSVCSYLEKLFPELKKRFNSEIGQKEIYKYLQETNPKVLEYLSYNERKDILKEDEEKKILEYAYRNERFICTTTKLKYYLGSDICKCNKLIVILDDIESLPYKFQLQLVMQYSRFFECMRNISRSILTKEYVVNFIIAMRPHTYSFLKGYQAFQAFFVTREIFKKNMINMVLYFKNKVSYYQNKIPHEKIESWENAGKILNILCTKFNSYYAKMINNLVLWNTRDAIEIYKSVLENRIWIQRNMGKTSSFIIDEENYIFNNISVLRAIACGHYYVYAKRAFSIIPNILYNTLDKNYSFPILYIFTMYIHNNNDDYTYGIMSKSYEEIVNCFISVFPDYTDIVSDVEFCIQYLLSEKILCRSINDIDNIKLSNKKNYLKENSLLYLSPKGFEIFNMINSDSVYMELCREDYYRDYSKQETCCLSSFELMQSGEQFRIFLDLLNLLIEISKEEKKYIEYSKNNNTLDIYKRYFGNLIISQNFYRGILRSIEFSGNSNNEKLIRKKMDVETVFKEIEQLFNLDYNA